MKDEEFRAMSKDFAGFLSGLASAACAADCYFFGSERTHNCTFTVLHWRIRRKPANRGIKNPNPKFWNSFCEPEPVLL